MVQIVSIVFLLLMQQKNNPQASIAQICSADQKCECSDDNTSGQNVQPNCKDSSGVTKFYSVPCSGYCTGTTSQTCQLDKCCTPLPDSNPINVVSLSGFTGDNSVTTYDLSNLFQRYPGMATYEDCGTPICILTSYATGTCGTTEVTGAPSSLSSPAASPPFYTWTFPKNSNYILSLCLQCHSTQYPTGIGYSQGLQYQVVLCFENLAAGTQASNIIPDMILKISRTNIEGATNFQTVDYVSNYASWIVHSTHSSQCSSPTYSLHTSDCSTGTDTSKYKLDGSSKLEIQNVPLAPTTFCIKSTNPHSSLQFVSQTFSISVQCESASQLLLQSNGLSTTQTVQVSTQPNQFAFSALDFDNKAPTYCSETYYLDVTGFTNPQSLVLSNSFTVSPSTYPPLNVGTYQFYIKAYIGSQGAGDFQSSLMTLIVQCDSGISITPPTVSSQIQYVDDANIGTSTTPNSFVFEEAAIQYAGCGPIIYELSQSQASQVVLTETPTLQVFNQDGTYGYAAPNQNLPAGTEGQSYNFYIRAKSTFPSSPAVAQAYSVQYTLYVGCSLSWTTITSPTLSQTSLTMSLSAASPNNEFTFPIFTPSISYCPIIDYSPINVNPSIAKVSKHSNCAANSNCLEQRFIIDLSTKQASGFNGGPITFQIQATSKGGQTQTSASISIDVLCGPFSNSVTETTNVQDVTVTQDYIGTSQSRNFPFDLSSFTLATSQCPVVDVQISTTSTALNMVSSADLQFTYNNAQTLQDIYPANTMLAKVYQFYIYIKLEGNYEFFSPIKTFTVLPCKDDPAIIVSPPASIISVQERFIGQANAIFSFDKFISSNAAVCPVVDYDYSLTYSLFSTVTALQDPAAISTNVQLSPVDALIHQEIKFYIRATTFFSAPQTIGKTAWYNQELIFRIGCGFWVTVSQPNPNNYDTTTLYQFNEGGASGQFHQILSFQTSHSYCPIEKYQIFTQDKSAQTNFNGDLTIDNIDTLGNTCGQETVDTSSQLSPQIAQAQSYVTCNKIMVNTAASKVWYLYIKAIAKGGSELFSSQRLTFEVWCNQPKVIVPPGPDATLLSQYQFQVDHQNRLKSVKFNSFSCSQNPCATCTVEGYRIMSGSNSAITHSYITSPVTFDGSFWTFNVDVYYPRTFTFIIEGWSSDTYSVSGASINGGNNFKGFSEQLTIQVVCGFEEIQASGQTVEYIYGLSSTLSTIYLQEKVFATFSSNIDYLPQTLIGDPFFPDYGLCANSPNQCSCSSGIVYFGNGANLLSIIQQSHYSQAVSTSIKCLNDVQDPQAFRVQETVSPNPSYSICSCFRTCGIIQYELFQDSAFSQPWTDSNVTGMDLNEINYARLLLKKQTPTIYNIYIRATSAGGKVSSPAQPLKIIVCGKEKIKSKSGFKQFFQELVLFDPETFDSSRITKEFVSTKQDRYFFITAASYEQWFEFQNSDPAYDKCVINRYFVAKDQYCGYQQFYKGGETVQLQTQTLNEANWENQYLGHDLIIKTTEPQYGDQTFYLCAFTIGNQFSYVEFNYAICGQEQVNLRNELYNIYYNESIKSKNEFILMDKFVPYFQSSSKICKVKFYSLVSVSNKEYTGQLVKITESYQIKIDTSIDYNIELKIRGSTKYSKNYAYIPLNITVYKPYIDPAKLPNMPPMFDTQISKFNIFAIPLDSESTNQKSFKLPTFSDAQGEEVTIDITSKNLDKSFFEYDNQKNQIILKNIGVEQLGNYEFNIRLIDSSGKFTDYTIHFDIREELDFFKKAQNDTSVQQKKQKSNQFERQQEICTAKIENIDMFGEVDILFSTNMVTEGFNHSFINSSVVDIYVVPAKDRHKNTGFDMSSINITYWNVTLYNNTQMKILINFTSPIDISPLSEQDELTIHFKNVSELGFYRSKELGVNLNSTTLTYKLRKQMSNTLFNRNFKSSSDFADIALKFALVLTIILNFFISGKALRYFIGMINSLQLIIHLPMISIIVPANVSTFFQAVIPIVCFDILSDFGIYDALIEFDDEQQEENNKYILDQMEDIDYDTHNAMIILGTMGFALFYWIFKAIVCLAIKAVQIYKKDNEKIKKLYKRFSRPVFFREFITITLEGYISFVVAGYLNLKMPLDTTGGEILSNLIAYVSFFISVIVMPLMMIFLIIQPRERLKTASFRKRWGQLYNHVNVNFGSVKMNSAYNLIFVFRRLLFCFNALWMGDYPSIQFLVVVYLCLSNSIFVGNVWPLTGKLYNAIELSNEYFILGISSHLMFFTEWMPTKELEYNMGWSMIILTVILMLFNLCFMASHIVHSMSLFIRKYWNIVKKKMKDFKEYYFTNPPPPPPYKAIVKRQNCFVERDKSQTQDQSFSEIPNNTIQKKRVRFSDREMKQIIEKKRFRMKSRYQNNFRRSIIPLTNFKNEGSLSKIQEEIEDDHEDGDSFILNQTKIQGILKQHDAKMKELVERVNNQEAVSAQTERKQEDDFQKKSDQITKNVRELMHKKKIEKQQKLRNRHFDFN